MSSESKPEMGRERIDPKIEDLLERALIKADMLRHGEPVAFGSDAAIIDELVDALADRARAVADARREAVEIARNYPLTEQAAAHSNQAVVTNVASNIAHAIVAEAPAPERGDRGRDYAGDIEDHDDIEKTVAIVRDAYDWCVSTDGTLAGLVGGDMGWAATHIRLKPEDIGLSPPTPAAPVTPAGSGGERERIAGLVIAHERLCVECGIALGSVPEDMAKTSRAALRSRGAILAAVQELVDERDQLAQQGMDYMLCLEQERAFVFDPATGYLHADDGGAPKHGIAYVPRDALAAAQAEIERQTRLVGQLRVDLSAFAVPEIECDGCGAPIGPDEPHHSGDVTGCWPYVSDVKTDHMPCYRYRTQQGVERSWPPCALLAPDASPQAESGREVGG